MLLGLISSLVLRAVRDALPYNLIAQERIITASLTALAVADVSNCAINENNAALIIFIADPVCTRERLHITVLMIDI
jgi:hypothetical protein